MTPANLLLLVSWKFWRASVVEKSAAAALLARHQGEWNKRVEVAVGGRQIRQWKNFLPRKVRGFSQAYPNWEVTQPLPVPQ